MGIDGRRFEMTEFYYNEPPNRNPLNGLLIILGTIAIVTFGLVARVVMRVRE